MPHPHSDIARSRILLGIALTAVIFLGLASRKFAAALPEFVAANAGDALWTVAVYLAIAIVSPSWSPVRLGLFAFGISVAVELSQLLEAPWLTTVRNSLAGRLLLGSGFLWIDLLRYLVGALSASIVDGMLLRRVRPDRKT